MCSLGFYMGPKHTPEIRNKAITFGDIHHNRNIIWLYTSFIFFIGAHLFKQLIVIYIYLFPLKAYPHLLLFLLSGAQELEEVLNRV